MNTRQYLRQVNNIGRMIENKDAERYKLEQLAQRLSAPIGGDRVQTSHNPDSMADTVIKIVEIEREIDTLVKTLLVTQKEVVSTIDSLPKQNWIDVLHKSYIQDKSLNDIADEMGYSVIHVKHLRQEAINEVRKIKKFQS